MLKTIGIRPNSNMVNLEKKANMYTGLMVYMYCPSKGYLEFSL